MQVEVIYNQAQNSLEFAQPLRLKTDHLRLVVNVPDDEISALPEPTPEQAPPQPQPASSYAARVDQILAPYQHLLQAHTAQEPMDYQAIWEEHLLEKYLGTHEKSDL